ncbi:hypothetical protein [Maricaulis sp.]|uniref:hypothetical protein n=1 Tax=Maricaulis sp. TaxID=1486257 RepID=UPI003A90AE41
MGLAMKCRNLKPAASVDAAGNPVHAGISETACRFVLVKIGDACNDDGEGRRPVAKRFIADDTDLSEKVVQRVLGRLQDIGIIKVWSGEAGGRGISRTYNIDLDRLASFIPPESLPKSMRGVAVEPASEKGDTMSPFSETKGGHENAERGTSEAVKGDACSPHYVDHNKNLQGAGERASEPRGSRAARPKSRRSNRQSVEPAAETGPPPDPPDIEIPPGLEGQIIAAALEGNDPRMPWKVQPWLGRFRVVMAMGGVRKLVIDGDEAGFRSVFTGAMKHLGLYGPEDRPEPIWRPDFLHRASAKGRVSWLDPGPDEGWFTECLRQGDAADGSRDEEMRYGTA